MITPYRRIVDANGVFITSVVMTDPQTGEWLKEPHVYILREGEQLIEAPPPPSSLVKPQWTGTIWRESATKEEIVEAKLQREKELEELGGAPVPEPAPPSQVEQLVVEVTTAMAGMQQQFDLSIAELTMAIAGGTEVKQDV